METEKLLNTLKLCLQQRLKRINHDTEKIEQETILKQELRKYSIENKEVFDRVVNMAIEELERYTIILEIDITVEELKKAQYILSNEIFKKSPERYNTAEKTINEIARAITSFALKPSKDSSLKLLLQEKKLLEALLSKVKATYIEGPFESIGDYMDFFEKPQYNDLTKDDIIKIIELMVVGDQKALQAEEEKIKRSISEIESKEVEIISNEVFAEGELDLKAIKEETNKEETSKEEIKPLPTPMAIEEPSTTTEQIEFIHTFEIPKEHLDKLIKVEDRIKKIIYQLKLSTFIDNQLTSNLFSEYANGNITLKEIKEMNLYQNHYLYFLCYIVQRNLSDIKELTKLNYREEDLDVAQEMFEGSLKEISKAMSLIEKLVVDKENDEIEVKNTQNQRVNKLIFVNNGSVITELEKSLKVLNTNNYQDIAKLLNDLATGNTKSHSKINNLYCKFSNEVVIFYRQIGSHILIFKAYLLKELSAKKLDTSINVYTDSDIKYYKDVISDNGAEYRKLIAESQEAEERIFDKLLGRGLKNA